MGPVQVLVVGFDQPAFDGEVLAEFVRLREAGIVRLVDVLLVARADDGSLQTVSPPGELDPHLGELVAAFLHRADEPDRGEPDDQASSTTAGAAWSLGDIVPPGCVVAVALIEHLWADQLTSVIRRAGGRPLEETWLARDDLDALSALVDERKSDPVNPPHAARA